LTISRNNSRKHKDNKNKMTSMNRKNKNGSKLKQKGSKWWLRQKQLLKKNV